MIKVKLNNRDIQTEPGKTILEVARDNGIEIPTLCHDEELSPYGSCWVCAVEVKGKRGFVTACGTNVSDGMEVITDSEEVRKARKMALELLLSDHYADCVAPCTVACPADVDVQTYVAQIANGQYHEAVKTIKQTLPMPLSIGRVCPAFCEHECRRTLVDDPIAIRQLKRHAADYDLNDVWTWVPERKSCTGKKIAIVGGGPSGLSAGYYLSNNGHDVVVFEAAPKAGGWLRYGIPQYRLPKEILDKEIDLMCRNGMEIRTGVEIGKDIQLDKLQKEYDAVYLAIGAQKAVPMRVQGADLENVLLGVDFLKDFAMGKVESVGKRVAIIGGGNTAVDCARTCRRLGADVTIVYRRTRNEMPAEEFEILAADEEGVHFSMLTNPVEFIGEEGKLKCIRFEKMELGEADSSGRRRPMPTGDFFEEPFDAVIAAISQSPDVDFLLRDENKIDGETLPLTRWQTADVNERTMYAGRSNVFAGGDFRRGPATAVEAIADGKRAADMIERFIAGKPVIEPRDAFDSKKETKLSDVSPAEYQQYEKKPREKMPELPADVRVGNFEEVETGFADKSAEAEAERCLECGCMVNETCALRTYATDYNVSLDLFIGDRNIHPIDDSHPFILRDANKCIKCGRCVRICSDVQGPGVLGYIYRGFTSVVAPEFGESLTATTCESCGKCIAVCPVGALTGKQLYYKQHPQSGEKILQNCGNCGTGCEIEVNTHQDRIAFVQTPEDQGFNLRNLCFKGRFGWQMYEDENRIHQPMKKTDKGMVPIEWDEATEILRSRFTGLSRFYICPDATNEEMLMLKGIADQTNGEIASLSYRPDFTDDMFLRTNALKTIEDLAKAESIVLVGQVSHTLRVLARHYQRKAKKLIIINTTDTPADKFADHVLLHDDLKVILGGLHRHQMTLHKCEGACGGCETAKAVGIDLPNRTVFVYNRNFVDETIIRKVWELAACVCNFDKGSGVYPTSEWKNLPGIRKAEIPAGQLDKADLILLWGETPPAEELEKTGAFVVSVHTHMSDEIHADLLLPMPSYLEVNGTAHADDGRVTHFRNPKESDLTKKLIRLFNKIQLLPDAWTSLSFWRGKAMSIEDPHPLRKLDSHDLAKTMAALRVEDRGPMATNLLKIRKIGLLKQRTKA